MESSRYPARRCGPPSANTCFDVTDDDFLGSHRVKIFLILRMTIAEGHPALLFVLRICEMTTAEGRPALGIAIVFKVGCLGQLFHISILFLFFVLGGGPVV